MPVPLSATGLLIVVLRRSGAGACEGRMIAGLPDPCFACVVITQDDDGKIGT